VIGTFLLLLLAGASVLLGLFGVHRAWLLSRFRWSRKIDVRLRGGHRLPRITVQLPLYDERAVAARAIRAAAALDYPRELLEIQVLDDSDDATRDIVDAEVADLRSRGIDARALRRGCRVGFKAGALAYGLDRAKGELIAVFDADFVPHAGLLRELAGAFRDPSVGMVQARWEHLNRDESWLTRAQAALLDSHFVITHKVRFERGLYFHFNGTSGIWRREAIVSCGGWELDTLTEDLDLSYRAQLAGWKLVYAAHLGAPAELPADVAAFKSQQARWARGTVQVARKLLGRVWRAPIPLRVKVEATVHFLSHAGHPLVLAVVALTPLVLAMPAPRPAGLWWLASCTPAVLLFYERAQRAIGRGRLDRTLDTVLALVLGIGMSWSLARAAFRGLRVDRGEFVRTPKRGGAERPVYRSRWIEAPGIELLLCAWSTWGLVLAVQARAWPAAFFLGLYVAGFAWVGTLSLVHAGWTARMTSASARPRVASPSSPVAEG
jgi:hypothetical protein